MMDKHIHELEKVSEDQKQEFYRCKSCGYGEYRPKPFQEPERKGIADRFRREKADAEAFMPEKAKTSQPSTSVNEEMIVMGNCLDAAEQLHQKNLWMDDTHMIKDIAVTMFIQKMQRRR